MSANGSAAQGRGVIESPFLEAFAWEGAPVEGLVSARLESPFLNAYATESLFEGTNPDHVEVRSLLAELYDSEFDEALYELAHDAGAASARVGEGGSAVASERLLEAWVAPLREESEQLFENVAGAFERTPLAALGDSEVDRVVDEAAAGARPLEPVFEQFLKKLVSKAKSVVKKAAGIAKKGIALAQKLSPVHLLLGKLKGLVKPLLDKVLKMALDKLPAPLRPAASKLAKQLGGAVGFEAEASAEASASADVGEIQREFDERVASLMFTADDGARELMLLEARVESEQGGGGRVDVEGLEAARARFVAEVSSADSSQAGPAVERFLPAILPALQLGVRLIGRPRVVSTLAKLVGKLIERFVGKESTPALSQAIVDAGMKLLSLEAPEQEEKAGPHAIASTIEEVARRVSEASDEVLDDSRLLEAEVIDAFGAAASAHFPQEMLHEDRRESATAGGTWTLFPKGGFKKYTRIFEVEITPDVARSIQTFGGTTLDAFLKDRLKVKLPLKARAHLYEAIPGTWLSKIARAEKGVAGLGRATKGSFALFHPLSKQNAGTLLKEPGLGRDVAGKYTSSHHQVAVGQRLFYLEIPGAPRVVGRASRVDVTADFPKDELRLALFLSEREAQGIAARLNSGGGIPTILVALKEVLSSGVKAALSGNLQGRVRIVHEAVDQQGFLGAALKRVGGIVLEKFAEKVVEWSLKALADELQKGAAAFVAATQDQADGVTVRIVLRSPPGFAPLRAALKGKSLPLADPSSLFKGAPTPSVQVVAGFAR